MTVATPAPSEFHKASSLRNRTFIGLLIAQFLAAFNDQAIHASAMFFAINKKVLTEGFAISLMPILFYAPWAIFCTLAGYYADRHSKRFALVFWKVAEIGITAFALLGFILGSELYKPNLGVAIVLSTVFLMGLHSTFFVPAKYGAMPEILKDELLSKGNGLLESLSFLATILGTVVGGVLSTVFYDNEYVIGLILVALAVIGAAASLLIRRMPPANPNRVFPPYIYQPLLESLRILLWSRPLSFAVVGIAFFTFMVAFMRGAVYLLGESRIPRWSEQHTSWVVGMTALGIGLGSPMAGWLSGKKVELGLIPIGSIGMIVAVCLAALLLNHALGLVLCIIMIGFFTGFYLVPMFTQLQHRAPKHMKGEVVATSNFTNVVGAMAASGLLFVLVSAAHVSGLAPKLAQHDVFVDRALIQVQEDAHHHPVFLQIADRDGRPINIGEPSQPERVPVLPFADAGAADNRPPRRSPQITFSQKALVAWYLREEALQEGKTPDPITVTVSKYEVPGVDREHYYVRLVKFGDFIKQPEPEQPIYDNRELPRYLFLGAGVMTLGVLFILMRMLPDLLRRCGWLLKSLRQERLRVTGIRNLPGYGPVILATNAATPEDIGNLVSASDRQVHFSPTSARPAESVRFLDEGHVVGLTVTPQEVTMLEKVRHELKTGVTILPAFCGPAHVTFGPPLAPDTPVERVLEAIQTAAMAEEL